ncbi:hypothetical protein Glove_186g57 [Diversispora epigaea]|uniref:Uncharacterized protein n=1 Tax=Diversispora epigaea TaxID=1348612 RepID=A0A397IVT2_9GLOM|nr:hypothetical protein Glove_186g57 [Diversispora epigaea]
MIGEQKYSDSIKYVSLLTLGEIGLTGELFLTDIGIPRICWKKIGVKGWGMPWGSEYLVGLEYFSTPAQSPNVPPHLRQILLSCNKVETSKAVLSYNEKARLDFIQIIFQNPKLLLNYYRKDSSNFEIDNNFVTDNDRDKDLIVYKENFDFLVCCKEIGFDDVERVFFC